MIFLRLPWLGPGGDCPDVANGPTPHAHTAAKNRILRVWDVDRLRGPLRESLMRLTAVFNLKQHMQKCFTAWR
jgi:hypothetical protein